MGRELIMVLILVFLTVSVDHLFLHICQAFVQRVYVSVSLLKLLVIGFYMENYILEEKQNESVRFGDFRKC